APRAFEDLVVIDLLTGVLGSREPVHVSMHSVADELFVAREIIRERRTRRRNPHGVEAERARLGEDTLSWIYVGHCGMMHRYALARLPIPRFVPHRRMQQLRKPPTERWRWCRRHGCGEDRLVQELHADLVERVHHEQTGQRVLRVHAEAFDGARPRDRTRL